MKHLFSFNAMIAISQSSDQFIIDCRPDSSLTNAKITSQVVPSLSVFDVSIGFPLLLGILFLGWSILSFGCSKSLGYWFSLMFYLCTIFLHKITIFTIHCQYKAIWHLLFKFLLNSLLHSTNSFYLVHMALLEDYINDKVNVIGYKDHCVMNVHDVVDAVARIKLGKHNCHLGLSSDHVKVVFNDSKSKCLCCDSNGTTKHATQAACLCTSSFLIGSQLSSL